MLQAIVIAFTLYTALKVYISIMQLGFLISQREREPILMAQDDYVKAANYAIEQEKISLFSHLVEYFTFLFWIIFGFSYFYQFFAQYTSSPFGISLLFIATFFAIDYLISLPIGSYKTFVVDKKYGFTNTTVKIFISDQIKSILFFLIFGLGFASLLIWFIEDSALLSTSGSLNLWWFYAFLAVMAIVLLVNFLYPTVIAPFFNKFSPLKDEKLKGQIEQLMSSSGMRSSGVFVMDASKRDSRLNAYFGGLGKSKRVVLFDTLLDKLKNNELLAVLGHELGHFKHGDIWKSIVLMALFFFVIFYILGHLPDTIFSELGVAPYAGMKLVFVV